MATTMIPTEFPHEEYTDLINLFKQNELIMKKYKKIKDRYSSMIDLFDTNWEATLQNTVAFKRWQANFRGSDGYSSTFCKVYRIPKSHVVTLLMAGNFMFFRKPKQSTSTEDSSNKCEFFNAGPIFMLNQLLGEHLSLSSYSSVRGFIPPCSGCDQCTKRKLTNIGNIFCSKYICFFNGSEFRCITSNYLKAHNKQMYMGLCVVEISSYMTFQGGCKLSGIFKEIIITTEPCIKVGNDEDEMMNVMDIADYIVEEEADEKENAVARHDSLFLPKQHQQPMLSLPAYLSPSSMTIITKRKGNDVVDDTSTINKLFQMDG